ncbi:MAG: hypothetical protein GY708_04775 [Actinomycetia bacterium]|nr:hypothetical protein [Actinomycetes bacterium]MCP4957937.1 hypothetical protein [Actinomycetes bacterium]
MGTSGRSFACLVVAIVIAASCSVVDTDGIADDVSTSTTSAVAEREDPSSQEGRTTTDDQREVVQVTVENLNLSETSQTLIPLQMYWISRYFEGVGEPTATDLAIAEILDRSPGAAAVFESAFATYAAVPMEDKQVLFDAEMVDLTAPSVPTLDLSRIETRIGSLITPVELGTVDPPSAPDSLAAANASTFGDPDGIIPAQFRVSLNWSDGSRDEDGFRIYRWLFLPLIGAQPGLVGTVGRDVTTFDDVLLEPQTDAEASLTWCYEVTAFREVPLALAGLDPVPVESEPSPWSCSGFWPPDVEYDTTDTDGDGVYDINDECPETKQAGATTGPNGCPDEDRDGWSDVPDRQGNVDHCTVRTHRDDAWGDYGVPNDTSGVVPPDGCPYRFAISWMGMEVTSNSAEYVHPLFDVSNPLFGGPSILYLNEVDEFFGEEPWLSFSWVNGLVGSSPGPHGSSEWCCGEGIDVASGDVWEPDGQVLAEAEGAELLVDNAIADHGLVVFPTSSISRVGGMQLTIALLERDWTAHVRESHQDDIGDVLDAVYQVVEFASCVYAPTVWCLIDAAEAIIDLIESIFGMGDAWVEVDDPDDWMGDGVWGISRNEAIHRTKSTGAYGFYVEIPNPQGIVCIPPVTPCTQDIGIPSGMIADVYFCLHREGLAEDQIAGACGPLGSYEPVRPWPMEPPDVP